MKARNVIMALVTLDALLAAALLWANLQGPGDLPTVPARVLPPDHGNAVVASHVPPPLAEFAEISERPLFVTTRRPLPITAAAPAAVQSVVAARPLQVIVLGVIVSGEHKLALLRIDNATQSRVVAEGDEIEGWKVVSITAQNIVIRGNGAEREIAVQKGPPVAGTGRSVPPPLPRR